jgi:hypothetical protein
MKDLTRRSVLSAVLPAALLTLALPRRAKASADQPHMHAALEALRTAKRELEAATQDKGGHRAKALAFVNDAIAQTEKGIAFDRTH